MACSVCSQESLYVYRITQETGIEYCNKCLPKFLYARRDAGLIETTKQYKAAIEEGLKNITKVPEEEVKPEPVEVEEKQPKKKPAKKKAE